MTFGNFQFVTTHKSCADTDVLTMSISMSTYQHTRQQVPSAVGKHNGRDTAIGGSIQQGLPIT